MRMLRFEKGDLVKGDYPIFCQQVNCRGVMGAGLAKQIRKKYPEVYREYKDICIYEKAILGICHFTKTSDGRICVCLFAQDDYGRDKRYTDYKAFKACLRGLTLYMKYKPEDCIIAFPYGIGCGLAGGDWNIVLDMLTDFSKEIKQDVVIVNL